MAMESPHTHHGAELLHPGLQGFCVEGKGNAEVCGFCIWLGTALPLWPQSLPPLRTIQTCPPHHTMTGAIL